MMSTDGKHAAHSHDRQEAPGNSDRVELRRLAIFEDRYGAGSYERLLAWLQQPCVTFAEIASRLHVTRERVRQWHQLLLPDAPSGRERRRQCGVYRQKKRLLGDPLFAAFYRHARQHVEGGRIAPVRSKVGYRTRVARVDGHLLAIREAGSSNPRGADSSSVVYRLARYRGRADFIYVKLGAQDFLVMPATALPLHGATFADGRGERYQQFKNTFDALRAHARRTA